MSFHETELSIQILMHVSPDYSLNTGVRMTKTSVPRLRSAPGPWLGVKGVCRGKRD